MAPDSDKDPKLIVLGRAVGLIREQRSMSTDALAEASGVLREHLDALEAGQLDPTYELLLEIADGLGVQPSALVVLAEQLYSSTNQ